MLAAGLWAGLLWGVDGRLPLLISGAVGAMFAAALLMAAAAERSRRSSQVKSLGPERL